MTWRDLVMLRIYGERNRRACFGVCAPLILPRENELCFEPVDGNTKSYFCVLCTRVLVSKPNAYI
jgi:hypothetical protein